MATDTPTPPTPIPTPTPLPSTPTPTPHALPTLLTPPINNYHRTPPITKGNTR